MKTVIAILVLALFAFHAQAQGGGRRGPPSGPRPNNNDRNRGPRPTPPGFNPANVSPNPNGTEGPRPVFGNVLNNLFGGPRRNQTDGQPQGQGRPRFPGQGGHREGGKDHRGEFGPHFSSFGLVGSDFSVYNQTVAGGASLTLIGLSQAEYNKVVLNNFDKDSEGLGFHKSGVLYDFTGTPVVVVKVGGVCLLVPADSASDYATVSATVNSRNGTEVTTLPATLQLNAVGTALSDAARSDLEQNNVNLEMFCANLPIYDTVAADAATFPAPGAAPEGQRILRFLTLDSDVSVLTDAPVPAPGPHRLDNHNFRGGDHHFRGPRPTTTTVSP